MRPNDGRAIPTFVAPGARGQAAHGLRRRLADAELLLRRRPGPRASSCSPSPASTSRSTSATPHEFTMLELAETVIRVTGSRSEIVFEALPIDDPQVRQPDITRATRGARLGAGDRPRGWAAALAPALGRTPVGVVSGVVRSRRPARPSCSLAVPAASASRGMLVGISTTRTTFFDDPQPTFTTLEQLHVQVAPGEPLLGRQGRRREARPSTPAIRPIPPTTGTLYDHGDRTPAAHGIKVLFSIVGTPSWANGGGRHRRRRRTPPTCSGFAYAAARALQRLLRRPDATPLPAVRLWLAWNEPNNPVYLAPQYVRSAGGG